MNPDFAEMLAALSAAGAEFLIIGAHAVAAHGYPRATGDLDIWIRSTPENAERVWKALVSFGAPLQLFALTDLSTPGMVLQIGLPPNRIDLLTSISGAEFETAWGRRLLVDVQGQTWPFLGREDLLSNKRAAGRPKDLADVANLEGRGKRRAPRKP